MNRYLIVDPTALGFSNALPVTWGVFNAKTPREAIDLATAGWATNRPSPDAGTTAELLAIPLNDTTHWTIDTNTTVDKTAHTYTEHRTVTITQAETPDDLDLSALPTFAR